jgi:hypothetical protein
LSPTILQNEAWRPTPSREATAQGPVVSVPLVLHSPGACPGRQPVTVGIPFPRGMLRGPSGARLLGPRGKLLPVQVQSLATWSDGSVKWLLLDLVVGDLPAGRSEWVTEVGNVGDFHGTGERLRLDSPAGKSEWLVEEGLRVEERPDAVFVSTGAATFHVHRHRLLPLARVTAAGGEVLADEPGAVLLTDRKGTVRAGHIDAVAVEASGPVRATVRLEGSFAGRERLRFVARLCFFAGTGLVRLRLTLHNPRAARHRGGLWDLGDRGSVLFRELALTLRPGNGLSLLHWSAEPGQPALTADPGTWELYQDSSGGENWQSPNHVNRQGRVPVSFRGYRVRGAAGEQTGLRASPVVALGDGPSGLTVAVPEFWQQFPKALEWDGRTLRVGLFPRQFGDLFELQGGEQKTHTTWLQFEGPPSAVGLEWAHRPVRAQAAPEWCAASGALPYLAPVSRDPVTPMDRLLHGALDGEGSIPAGRERADEYGWRNYGEIYADHEAAYYKGMSPLVSHYNNQYDVVYGTILRSLRTGDPAWADVFDPLARHVIDIDIYHTQDDRPAYSGGLFWHTDHYRTAGTATHRAYSRVNRPAGADYGGGPCNEHNYTTGLLHYYYLTGDAHARDAVVGLADWVVRMDDGARTLLGVVDDGPTGLASSTTRPTYHGPGRGCGNSVNALLDGWLLTGRRGYLARAEELIRRCIHPEDDVDARDLLNVEERWSYTVFLSVLARYLDLKREAGELDAGYAHARASLLHYAQWMLGHEVPYFDTPEKLEYPTETWAAQDYRKANVLRLAAAHAEPAVGAKLLGRADELARRAWEDLHACRPSVTARARALLFVEGTRDDSFRRHGVTPAPAPAGSFDWGPPRPFVRQRDRVLAQVKTVPGLARVFVRLLDARRWWRVHSRRAP